ncbi:methyltransferase domain-containing protein [Euzebya sp.]|uniref:methyltransferase domain-containing protein n=1 Tax=Euzebya sp. TaxID=1971409 RepID=UPI003515B172
MGLTAILDLLACPVCAGPLVQDAAGEGEGPGPLRCDRGHAVDVARQGYVTLTRAGIRHDGDTAAMVDARGRVQDAGQFEPLTEALVDVVPEGCGTLLDVGAGTGHHLSAVLSARHDAVGIALDSSTAAAKRAARAHPRIGAVRADAAAEPLPVRDESIDTVLVTFAPRAVDELARVLRPDGLMVVAVPAPDHLAELRDPLGMLAVDPVKSDRLAGALGSAFTPAGTAAQRWTRTVTRDQARDLAAMGPAAFHTGAAEMDARAAALPDVVDVTFSVVVGRWRAAGGGARSGPSSP